MTEGESMRYEHELVQNIIDTYERYGLKAVVDTRWNLGGGHWERNLNSALMFLQQWCADNDTYEVLTAFEDYIKRTEMMHQRATHAVAEEDFSLLEQLNEERADVVCAVVFVSGMDRGSMDWMRWACDHVGAEWDNCFAQVFSRVAGNINNMHGLQTVLGGWCTQCHSAQCASHEVRSFLNSTHIGLLAQILDQKTQNTAYSMARELHIHTRLMLELIRTHPIWDNTNLYIQTCVERLVMQAARVGDVNSLKLLIGPNDRLLSETEQKQLICINREHITHALILHCHNAKTLARIAPVFAGLVDGDLLHKNPYLADFLVLHQQTVLSTATNNAGALRPRKM